MKSHFPSQRMGKAQSNCIYDLTFRHASRAEWSACGNCVEKLGRVFNSTGPLGFAICIYLIKPEWEAKYD